MDNRISIVIPIYNRGYCLSRCLDSVLEQTFTDWECILVDDGSTDNSLQVCQEYATKDFRFQVVLQPENKGVSQARNRGMDLAKGEYIAFIDSDDWIEANYLSGLYQSAGEKIMPLCKMAIHDKNGEIHTIHELQDKTCRLDNSATGLLLEHLINGLMGSSCSRLYNRMIIEKYHLRFQPGVNWGEDLIFNCSYFEYIESIKCVPVFYHVMEQEISLSSSFYKNPLLIENNMKLWNSVYTFLEKKGIRNKEINNLMLDYLFRLVQQPVNYYYANIGHSVSGKDRLAFIKYMMKNIDGRVIKMFSIPKNRSQLKYFPVYYRMSVLVWLFCEFRLLKNKYIINR